MAAGALIGNAGCAGCAAGQIGQNGPGEMTVSSGNRNFAGKQGKGEVYLASPATCAATATAGMIARAMRSRPRASLGRSGTPGATRWRQPVAANPPADGGRPRTARRSSTGRVWLMDVDNIDTDMIFHNRHLAITDIDQMGRTPSATSTAGRTSPARCVRATSW